MFPCFAPLETICTAHKPARRGGKLSGASSCTSSCGGTSGLKALLGLRRAQNACNSRPKGLCSTAWGQLSAGGGHCRNLPVGSLRVPAVVLLQALLHSCRV